MRRQVAAKTTAEAGDDARRFADAHARPHSVRLDRRTVIGLLSVATVGVAAVGCSVPGRTTSTPAVQRQLAPESAPLTWPDQHLHLVVYARAEQPGVAGVVGTAATSTTAAAGASRPAHGSTTTTQPPTKQPMTVRHLDGSTTQVDVPAESLLAIAARTPDEATALHAVAVDHGGVAILVLDSDGRVGRAGAAYAMTGTELIELTAPLPPTTTVATTTPAAGTTDATSTTQAGPTGDGTDGPAAGLRPPAGGLDAASQEAFLDALRRAPGVVSVQPVASGVAAVATSGDRESITSLAQVAGASEDALLDYADDPRQGEQWALLNTGAPEQAGGWAGVAGADTRATVAWRVGDGTGSLVAVIDSGIDLTHPDLAGHLWQNPGETCGNGIDDDHDGKVDDCQGWDFGSNDADPNPDPGAAGADHGTHVAGLIAAGRNGIGIAGIAPGSTVMPLKVANATGTIAASAVYAATVFAVDHGAKIINISLATRPGTPRSSASALENAVAYARGAGVLVVTGAGNDAVDITPRSRAVWPAGFSLMYDNVITVGATTNADGLATFSNFGDPVTMYAPGFWMLSTTPAGQYAYQSGTSQAAALVSGAAADVLAAGLATTPASIKALLRSSAAVVDAGLRLDLATAMGIPPDPVVTVQYSGVDTLAPDQTATLGVRVQAVHMPAPVAKVRLSIAAAVDYQIFAVQGVAGSLGVSGGPSTPGQTDATGAFAPVVVTDPSMLATSGLDLDASLSLPTGDYALVTELLDGTDAPMAGAQVAYVTVGAGTPVHPTTTTTVRATSTTAAGGTTAPPTTSAGGSTTTTGTGTTVPAGPTTTADPNAPTTTADPNAPTTTADPNATTTVPGTTATTATTAPGAGTTAPATTPGTTSAPTTATPTTAATPTTRAVTTTTSAAGTTAPTTAAPSTSAGATTTTAAGPPTTTPAPPSQSQGIYRISTVSPRYATIVGGTAITITGVFPTTIPVNVWFGNKGIVQVTSTDGTTLVLNTPTVVSTGVTDVSVKFTLDTLYSLTLTRAFTFGTAPAAGTTTTVRAGATTTTRAPTATGPTTTRAGATTTAPRATTTARAATTTTRPATTLPGATTTTVAGGSTTSTTTPVLPTAGVHLQPAPSTGALSRLDATAWPRPGCKATACPAATLP